MPLPLEIKKIDIVGLNHKCNVSFELGRDCTILIGENGVGKTSALHILQLLLSGMMTSIAGYVFDFIRITDSECVYEFTNDDFLVPIDVITNKFEKICLTDVMSENIDYLKNSFTDMILEIKEKELLGKLLDELFYADSFSLVINKIVEQYMDARLLFKIELETEFPYPCYKSSFIYSSQFYKNIVSEKYWNLGVVFGDMVEKTNFPSIDDSFIHFRISSPDEENIKLDDVSESDLEELIKNIDEYEVQMYFDEFKTGIGTLHEYFYSFDKEFQQQLLSTLNRNENRFKGFDIHSVIRSVYFDSFTVQKVNDIAIEGIKKYWEYLQNIKKIKKNEIENLIKSIDKMVLYVHDNYICPILAEELPYRTSLSKMLKKIKWCIENKPYRIEKYLKEISLLKSYMEIFEEMQEIVLSQENVAGQIRAFQDLVSQYIEDKIVCVTPKGINIYLQEDKEMTFVTESYKDWMTGEEDEGEQIVFGDANTELSLNNLSSGECKIIMLAFYAIFASRAFLIMDEPELSISILWQQKLLRDLLDYGQFNSIIVATHSPYIARDDSLANYIEYLP